MSGGKRRWHPPLSQEDLALWEQVKAGVEPLRRRPSGAVRLKLAASDAAAPHAGPVQPPRSVPAPAAKPPAAPQGLDRLLVRRVRRGLEPIARRLDLHGLRQDEAHRQLLAFLREAQRRGDRVVLLITGKGREDDGERGVLRRAVPRWLRLPEFHALVVGFAQAEAPHGGAGALYVHVRRARHHE